MDRYQFQLSDGKMVVGVVQGTGGELREETDGLRRLLAGQKRAEQGRPMVRMYEPQPGCVLVMPEYSAEGRGPEIIVPLVGARISLAGRTDLIDQILGSPMDPGELSLNAVLDRLGLVKYPPERRGEGSYQIRWSLERGGALFMEGNSQDVWDALRAANLITLT